MDPAAIADPAGAGGAGGEILVAGPAVPAATGRSRSRTKKTAVPVQPVAEEKKQESPAPAGDILSAQEEPVADEGPGGSG